MSKPHERLKFSCTKNPNVCTGCRKSKQKCGGQRPICDRCEKNGRVCIYLDPNMVSGIGAAAAQFEKDKTGNRIEGAGGEAIEKVVKKKEGHVSLNFDSIGNGEMNEDMDFNMDMENSNIPVAEVQPSEERLRSHVFTTRQALKKNASSVVTNAHAHTPTHISNASEIGLESFSAKKPSARKRSLWTKAISGRHEATNNNMGEVNSNVVRDSEVDTYHLTAEAAADFKRGRLQAEAMFALRGGESLPETRPIIFDDIDLTSLDSNAKQAWDIVSRQVFASIAMAEEGVEWDLKGTKRSGLRDLILDLNEQQKIWRETPELMLAFGRLAQAVLQLHDFYEQLGACMTSLTGLGLVLNPPAMPFYSK